eukprot:778807-Rhodomonas_salina.1
MCPVDVCLCLPPRHGRLLPPGRGQAATAPLNGPMCVPRVRYTLRSTVLFLLGMLGCFPRQGCFSSGSSKFSIPALGLVVLSLLTHAYGAALCGYLPSRISLMCSTTVVRTRAYVPRRISQMSVTLFWY